jgi:hypothetical protein
MAGIDNDTFEHLAEGAAKAAPNLSEIKEAASKLVGLQAIRDGLEEQIKSVGAQITELAQTKLPDMMAQAGLSSITLDGGAKIVVEDFCSGSLPRDPEKRAAAVQWLVDNGAEGIVKANVTVEFGKAEFSVAQATQAMLKDQGLEAQLVENVHPQTLAAFGRERMRNGEPLPDVLGLFVGKKAKVK